MSSLVLGDLVFGKQLVTEVEWMHTVGAEVTSTMRMDNTEEKRKKVKVKAKEMEMETECHTTAEKVLKTYWKEQHYRARPSIDSKECLASILVETPSPKRETAEVCSLHYSEIASSIGVEAIRGRYCPLMLSTKKLGVEEEHSEIH